MLLWWSAMTEMTRVFLSSISTSILRLRSVQRSIVNTTSSSSFVIIIHLELSLKDLSLERLLSSDSMIYNFKVNTTARISFPTILKLCCRDFFLCLWNRESYDMMSRCLSSSFSVIAWFKEWSEVDWFFRRMSMKQFQWWYSYIDKRALNSDNWFSKWDTSWIIIDVVRLRI